ncbi:MULTISPECIES: class I SAM-dependent methyltransferase [Sphingobium]|uniref:class I SAM-dependent methyltransferase n=1 Tax=Sphingobium TaxID=165695 RepID=UPI000C4C9B6C|nr:MULTISPECIES: methyltransferase [Sphingobium]MBS47463.1 methyltransferase [Sphingobium sp.]MCC4257238.1 methyltransferase [Sphingobium lactosutens]MEE2740199.1 methyltransferase [Pseudomonadota bacterium]HCW60714.1 methyltransferase [Sphingobium sp.]
MNRLVPIGLAIAGLALPAMPLLAQHDAHAGHQMAADPIAAAVAAPTRKPANVARDQYRHPAETLAFFGVTPMQTVVEYSPSGGWYSEILAPLIRDHGTFYALQPSGSYLEGYKSFLASNPVYDQVKLVAYPEEAASIPAGSVDTVLTFRNVHNMVMGGKAADTFKAFYTMLKPGGTLGVVDHRLPEDRDSAAEMKSGYLKVSTVRKLAEDAGFEYVGASEVNANPKDTADWDKGVWTLPPVLRNKDVDKAKYMGIGESDRMTLKFRKPTA